METNNMDLQKIMFKNVQEVIIDNDPVGLIDGGAPIDEYHDEINKILSILLKNEINKEFLVSELQIIFKKSFGENAEIDRNALSLMSDRLLELKERLNY